MEREQAMKEIQSHLVTMDNITGMDHKNINNKMGDDIQYSTYKAWLYNGKFPLAKIFFHPFSIEILEYMLSLAIRIKRCQNHVRIIDVERAMLELKEGYEICDDVLVRRSSAKVKSLLNFVSTDREKMQQTRLSI